MGITLTHDTPAHRGTGAVSFVTTGVCHPGSKTDVPRSSSKKLERRHRTVEWTEHGSAIPVIRPHAQSDLATSAELSRILTLICSPENRSDSSTEHRWIMNLAIQPGFRRPTNTHGTRRTLKTAELHTQPRNTPAASEKPQTNVDLRISGEQSPTIPDFIPAHVAPMC